MDRTEPGPIPYLRNAASGSLTRPMTVEAHRAGESAHQREVRTRNRRTGLILVTVALAFFIGIIVKYLLLNHSR